MTTYKPQGRYDWCTDITSTIFGTADRSVVLFHDFECELDIDTSLSSGGDLDITVTDVLVDGESLHHGDDMAKAIRLFVMAKANEDIENGGWLWGQVREAEGLSLTGHPNDPDTHWQIAAE